MSTEVQDDESLTKEMEEGIENDEGEEVDGAEEKDGASKKQAKKKPSKKAIGASKPKATAVDRQEAQGAQGPQTQEAILQDKRRGPPAQAGDDQGATGCRPGPDHHHDEQVAKVRGREVDTRGYQDGYHSIGFIDLNIHCGSDLLAKAAPAAAPVGEAHVVTHIHEEVLIEGDVGSLVILGVALDLDVGDELLLVEVMGNDPKGAGLVEVAIEQVVNIVAVWILPPLSPVDVLVLVGKLVAVEDILCAAVGELEEEGPVVDDATVPLRVLDIVEDRVGANGLEEDVAVRLEGKGATVACGVAEEALSLLLGMDAVDKLGHPYDVTDDGTVGSPLCQSVQIKTFKITTLISKRV